MNIQKIFRGISEKLQADFSISSNINHNSSKGTYRENALAKFLSSGHLPEKFAIGSGEIVGPAHEVSQQSDLIIYDKLNGIPLVYSENNQVFPVESVYGIIEVKSTLSKSNLIEALNNIKSVKEIAPEENVVYSPLPFIHYSEVAPLPFGIVFAYKLASNTLQSLEQNLREWQEKEPTKYWPNIIAILDEGLIYHERGMFEKVFDSKKLGENTRVTSFPWKKDTLLHFYMALLDLCRSMNLTTAKLSTYLEKRQKIGQYSPWSTDGPEMTEITLVNQFL